MPAKNWISAPLAENESQRLDALQRYRVLDTPPEEAFDRITRMASRLFHTPIALVSLVDGNRQWFKSHHGLDATETPRELAFCAHTILGSDVMVVKNTLEDKRFAGNPLVVDQPAIRFYAGAPLTTPDGFNLGTLCVIDSKAHADLTQEQKDVLKDLAGMVITELELRNITHIANKANQAKTDFLANMSHEIRTPMNGIVGMAQLLKDTTLNGKQRELTSAIHGSANNLLHLLNDFLDLSRIESGKFVLEELPFDITANFKTTVQTLQPLAAQKGIALDLLIDADLPAQILGDSGRVMQVLTNLIGNAIKFTAVGSVKVELRHERQKNILKCNVIDTGIGIPSEKKEIIFQRFTQSDESISRQFGGTGLGLTIAKDLVTMMGGLITVESTPGKGSTFTFSVPVRLPDQATAPVKTHQTRLIPVNKARVLIAEDNPVSVMFMHEVVKMIGFHNVDIDIAEDGAQAVNKHSQNPYSIIFMDCQMPVYDGYQAANMIRAMELEHAFPTPAKIIATTANAMPGESSKCLAAGMDDYISKPIDIEKLKAMVGQWFDINPQPAPHATSGHADDAIGVPVDMKLLKLIFSKQNKQIEFMKAFFMQADVSLNLLRRLQDSQDHQQWEKAAHHISGAAANIGAAHLARLLNQAKTIVPDGSERPLKIIEAIALEIERIREYYNVQIADRLLYSDV